jgi:hypothetical protein
MLRRSSDRFGVFVFAALLLLCANFAHAQAIRWDLGAPGSAGAVLNAGTGSSPLFAQPNIALQWCTHPANAVPCTNLATTYSSLSGSTACPTNQQIVLQGSNSCQATSDNFGNLGVYVLPNTTCNGSTCYDYTLTVNGNVYGPYVWAPPGGSGGGGFSPPASAIFPGSISVPQIASFGPSSPAGVAAILWNGPDPFCLYNANGIDMLCDAADPATGLSSLAWNPGTPVNQRLFSTLFSSTSYNDGQVMLYQGKGPNVGYWDQSPSGFGIDSQSGAITTPSINLICSSGTVVGAPTTYSSSSQICNSPLFTDVNAVMKANPSFDFCQAVTAAQMASPVGIADARAVNAQKLYCGPGHSTNMFFQGQTAGSTVFGALILGTNSSSTGGTQTIYLDTPSAGYNSDGNGSTVSTPYILLPNQFQGIYGAVGKAAVQFEICTGAGTPYSQCQNPAATRPFTITSTSLTGNLLTVTTSTALACSGGSENLWVGEPIQIEGSGTANNNMARLVVQCNSAPTNTFVIEVPTGTGNCAASCGTAYGTTSIFAYAGGTNGSSFCEWQPVQCGIGIQSFGQHLFNLQMNLQGVPGLSGIYNVNGGDQTGVENVEVQILNGIGLFGGLGSADWGKVTNFRVTNLNVNAASPATVCLWNAYPMRGYDGGSCVLPYTSSANQANTCLIFDGPIASANAPATMTFDNWHEEGCANGIEVGDTYVVRGLNIRSNLGQPTGAHSGTNVLVITADGNGCAGCTFEGIERQSGGATNTIVDNQNGGILCTDFVVGQYQTNVSTALSYTNCLAGTAAPTTIGSALAANFNSGSAYTIYTPQTPTDLLICATEFSANVPTGATLPSLTLGWTDATATPKTVTLLASTGSISSKSAYATNGINSSNTALGGSCAEIGTNSSTPVTVTSASYAAGSGTALTYDLLIRWR